jgi:hypothetical protein
MPLISKLFCVLRAPLTEMVLSANTNCGWLMLDSLLFADHTARDPSI